MDEKVIVKIQSVELDGKHDKVSVKIKVGADGEGLRFVPQTQDLKIDWNPKGGYTIPAPRTDQIMQLAIRKSKYLCTKTIGFVQCPITDIPYDTAHSLNVYDKKNRSKHIGIIVFVIERTLRTEDPPGQGLHPMLESVGGQVREVHRAQEARLDGASTADKVQKVIDKLESLEGIVNTIDQLAEMHSAVKLAWSICSSLFKIIQRQASIDQKIVQLIDAMDQSFELSQDAGQLRDELISLKPKITDLLKQVSECASFLCDYLQLNYISGLFHHNREVLPFTSTLERFSKGLISNPTTKVDDFIRSFARFREALGSKVDVHTALVTYRIEEDTSQLLQENAIKRLPTIATTNVAGRQLCLDATRDDVLHQINDWITHTSSEKNILWLHGLAGSGKSTIAATVSVRTHSLVRNSVFLFFERSRLDQERVITTLASELANLNPVLRLQISAVIEENPSIVRADLDKQFKYLIRDPFIAAEARIDGIVLIVIDGLDEYGHKSQRRPLLSLISASFGELPNRLRFLITSRPESDIYAEFTDHSRIEALALDADGAPIQAIRFYLASQMATIWKEKKDVLDPEWPGDDNLDALAQMSEGLFIWASTLSEFLSGATRPDKRLQEVFSSDGKRHTKRVDSLYATILSTQISTDDWEDAKQSAQLRAALAIALFSATPLTDTAIDDLLRLDDGGSCKSIFGALRSLLDYKPGWPIRPLHASFRDYLEDPSRSGKEHWTLANFDAHQYLTMCCSRIMESQLRFNICDFPLSDGVELSQRIENRIPQALDYACRYWFHHLLKIHENLFPSNLHQWLELFITQKLYLWVEILCLSLNISAVSTTFDRALRVPFSENHHLLKLFNNVRYFLRRKVQCGNAVSSVYISDSALTHPLSPLDKIYASDMRIPNIISSVDVPLRDSLVTRLWAPIQALPILAISCQHASIEIILGSSYDLYCLRVEIGYHGIPLREQILHHAYDDGELEHPQDCIASRDLRRIAKKTRDEIQIWIEGTGWGNIPITRPESFHGRTGTDVALHPTDPNVLAYFDRSTSNSIHVVDVAKKSISLTIHIESDSCNFLTWSDDGSNLAFGSNNYKTSIWYVDLTRGIATQKVLFERGVNMLCFRPSDASQILLVDRDSIELCSVESGECIRKYNDPLREYATYCSVMATFSLDGDLFATCIRGGLEIVIYETETGHKYQGIPLPQPVRKVEFTPNRKRLVAVCGSYLLPGQVDAHWSSTLGEEIYVVDIDRECRASDDVRFDWAEKRGHSSNITSASFSPDKTKFLTSSDDGTIHVRRTSDCMLLREYWPLEHESPISNAVWSIDDISIYYSLECSGTLYSLSPSGIRVLYDTTQLDPSSKIHAIKSYSVGAEERIALILSDSMTSYGKSKIILFSTDSVPAVLLNTYSVGGRPSISSDGLVAYYQDSWRGHIVLLDLERGTSNELFMRESFGYTSGQSTAGRLVIFPKGSRVMLVKEVTRKAPMIVEGGPMGSSERKKISSDIAVSDNKEEDSSMVGPNNQVDDSNPSVPDNEVGDEQVDVTIFECTIWDVAAKAVIQTFSLSEPSSRSYYDPMKIAISSDGCSIAFTGFYYDDTLVDYTPHVVQVWTWSGEVFSRTIEHSIPGEGDSGCCIDITRDSKRLLMTSGEGVIMVDIHSILLPEENQLRSTLSASQHTGSLTHASTVPPGWVYHCENNDDQNAQILDQNGHELLVLPKEMMERLDPPGSSHVIRRNRLKIDANKLLEMQDWVKFFKPASNDKKA